MTSYTYAIGDIHGCFDLVQDLLNKIKQHNSIVSAEKTTIVFLGDYIDRGPQSAQVVEFLRGLKDDDRVSYIMLKGNHENMMVNVDDFWLPNGGVAAIQSYKNYYGEWWEEWLAKDAEWMGGLPARYQDDHRAYVHAAFDHIKPFDEQSDMVNMWTRYDKDEDWDFFGKHVVHGHTPQKKPLLLTNRTNIDTGSCFKGGALTAAAFKDDKPGGPVAIMQSWGN